jgi:hypothetical protein
MRCHTRPPTQPQLSWLAIPEICAPGEGIVVGRRFYQNRVPPSKGADRHTA